MPPLPLLKNAFSASHKLEDNHDDDEERLAKALIEEGSIGLDQLRRLQTKGWKNKSIKRHFRIQRQTAANSQYEPTTNIARFERMKSVLREIDGGLHFIPKYKYIRFLDLCCCPGGFSSYILDENIKAQGFGISLPVADGGQDFILEDHHRSRFQLFNANITHYQLGTTCVTIIPDRGLPNLPPPISQRTFDLAILDGYQLRTRSSSSPLDNDGLLISQIIVGLQAVKEGGTILARLPLPHKPLSAKIIYLLATISEKVQRWKLKSMHADRGVFYAIAKGVGKGVDGARIPAFLQAFKELWESLTINGEGGLSRCMTPEDLDFLITTDDLVRHQLKWLVTFGRPLWKIQQVGMRELYSRNGV